MTVTIDRHPTAPDRIKVSAAYRYKDLIKTCPGARWNKDDGFWSVPLAWTACLAMRGIFDQDLVIGDELLKWSWDRYERVIKPATELRLSMDAPGDERLYSYQRAGVAWLKLVERGLLMDEMGTGKTVQTIVALQELQIEGRHNGPMLIVCPNTMKGTWKRELAKWWPEVISHVIGGTAAKRAKQFKAIEEDIAEGKLVAVIINWEGIRSHSRLLGFGSIALKSCVECKGDPNVKVSQCETHPRELNGIEFAAVVADEIHRALDPTSKQTRALRAASGDAYIRFGLTGTPISKDPTQLWTLLNWVDESEWPTKSNWVERLIDYGYNIYGGREIYGLNPVTENEFRQGVDPKTRRMLKEIVLPFLPPVVREVREVEMNPKQRKQYTDMEELLVARLDMGTLVAANAMVQVGRLVQLASSCGDIDIRKVPDVRWFDIPVMEIRDGVEQQKVDEDGMPVFVKEKRHAVDPITGELLYKDQEFMKVINPSAKIDAFLSDLDDFQGQSVAVFAESRQLIELLSEAMTKKKIVHGLITGAIDEEQRNRTIDAFQAGNFQFVLVTIKAGGTGITLTKASTAVFLQRNWSPIDMDQAYARTHRIGSEIHDSITVIDYITKDTVEDSQVEVLKHKEGMIEEIVQDNVQLAALIRNKWEPPAEAVAA